MRPVLKSLREHDGLLNCAQKVALADFHAALAQQRIHDAFVKVEVRQCEIGDVGKRRELPTTVGKFDFDGRLSALFT